MFPHSFHTPRRFTRVATIASAAVLFAGTVAATAPTAVRPAIHATAQTLTLSPTSPALAKLFTWADTASGTETDEYKPSGVDTSGVAEAPIDIGPVTPGVVTAPGKPCNPVITKAKGKLTSGGYIVIEGTCLGKSGNVVVTGFPNNPHLTIEAWTPTALTAQFPTITGVPDLTMKVQVVENGLSSKTFDAKYIAALGEPVRLPNKYVVNNECALYGACSSAPHSPVGTHWDYSPQNGADVWTIHIPDHFRLTDIKLAHLTTGKTSTSTIDASSTEKTFKVAWTENQLNGHQSGTSAQTTTTSCGSDFGSDLVGLLTASNSVSCSTSTTGGQAVEIPTYNDTYRVEPMVRGPAGMTP